ncbi:MAG: ABC transporter ATP-binding protein [Candidatus Margulisbacteria bacterium]|nr:ABC transporter ATP-binding protein [Candidatus Margulisiibacteriota bacterium]
MTLTGVRLENVYKNFGKVEVVVDVSMEIKPGEFMVLVGPSGCGKTTTLRMIAGLEEVTSGKIYIDNNDVTFIPPKDRDIAMVFQNYALYPHMTVRENLGFALKMRKNPKNIIDERVAEAAEILGLKKLLDRKPKELSGGQRQRVALGRAIVRQPKVFLMDEPLSNLDAKLRVQMRGVLKKLHERLKTTIVYVTHDQVEAMTLGSRICIMNDGVIQQLEEPMKVYSHPSNIYVAGFIGSPSMNFFDGVVKKKGADYTFLANGFELQLPKTLEKLLKGVVGIDVVLGVRPEDIVDYEKAVRKNYAKEKVYGNIEFAELLGAQTFVHVKIGDKMVMCEVDPSFVVALGAEIELGFNLKNMYLFDKATNKAII